MAKNKFFYGVSNVKSTESEKRYVDIAKLFINEFYCKLNDKKEFEFVERKPGEITKKMLLVTTKTGIITYTQLKKCIAIANRILLDTYKINVLLGLPEISNFAKEITIQCQFKEFVDSEFSTVNCKKPVENKKKSGEDKTPGNKPENKTPENKPGENKPENDYKPELNKPENITDILDKIDINEIINYLKNKGYDIKEKKTGKK